ncbi:disease resistance-like protein CSA1 isoform X2 [Prunus persica]|uniref:disease resistance-like protein CSA1 isoform X2 n=1 Tax=Prunus persica TaxID=3760 RepID=UPI0009AB8926|nr:disease resistance-like protein CSA1 isoform X2 [Prunus persica]
MDERKAYKASSSSSLSSSSKRWEYHIFLSFRGEDTRNGFTSHLHKALESRGYDVFMDEDDLQVGQVIKPELLQAIEKSKISVIVFSTRYADSSWCLDELVKIMECRRTLNQIVLPIFYKVDPSDVRKQTGTLASDFQKHTIRHKDEVVKEWRKALTEAADLCAGVLEDRNEAKFIEAFIENNIVGRLSTTPLPVAAYPVGVDSRVHDMISYLLGGGSQDVVVIGIWGMGGLGKTTAAKAIYNRIKDKFEAHGFLGDIRDTANRHGLIYLQKLLLAEINKKPTKFHISCVDGGMGMIKEELGRKRVLVIIDDVDEKEQLEAIVGNGDWFGSGSRIIITTRDKHFLDVLHVNKTFTVPEMNPDEGLELFCRHAFQKGCPNKRYLELSKKVVFYSGGLPLALKVLGSFLVERTIAEWESQLEELEGIPPKDILKKLRISYDSLDHIEKCIFLDISCFFIGINKDQVRKILDGCGFKAEIKISVLLQKCLVTVNEENQLTMHDLLRDMGRAISQEGDPEDRSRLWLSPEDLTDVLEDKSGTKVERLALNLRSSEKASFGTEAFSKMRKLKLLQLNYAELTGEYKFLSKNLRWLCWHGFLLDSIPGDFDLRSLVAMDLQFSKLKIVWKDCKLLEKLTIINLSHSHDLTTSPDFSKVPNLEELILECTSLSDVHESIGDLKRLALVNLEHCKMLKDLPLNLYRSKSIETLLLNGCSSFENLAEGLGDMVSLRTLEADDTAVTKIPSSIVKLKNLRSLSLCGLERLTGFLPHSYLRSTGFLPPLLDGLNSLRKLALANCSLTDDELPKDLGSLSSLEHLDCGQNSFCRLPSLSGLSKLEYLCLNDCRKLREIPELPTNLKVLRGFGCTALETMPDFSEMSSIRELYLSDSSKLTEIPGLDKSLNSVTRIHMEGCTNLTTNFRNKILQGWTSCGFGGIYLEGLYGIPKWFFLVGNEYNEVDFEVPQIFSWDLKGLTLCCVYSSDNPKPKDGLGIMVRNVTQGTTLHTWPAIASVKTDSKPEDDYLWQGQLSNDMLSLQVGDKVLLSVFATVDFVIVKKAAVNLEWDKVMKENMHDSDPHLYDLSRAPDEAGPSQVEPLRELVLASCNFDIDLSKKIEKAGSTDVGMIGIWGMGGIGKTALAKTIYNEFERIFEGRSFLANAREVIAHQPTAGLVGLLEQLLNDILKSKDPIKVDSVEVGIDMIRARLRRKRALVIIDDADDLQQLKAIAGARDWFGPGSRIVITTRNKHLLEQVGVDSMYMAEEMDEKEALELWHAFESGYPNQEYLDLSKRVIRYCQGLPLALKVFGSFLKKRTTAEWESHLEKLERSPPDGDIQKIFRISFDSLPDDTTREIFLDISCFFIGMDKDYVTQILDGCGFYATIRIRVLIERCLVTVSEQNELMMHDLLRDMGREIVRKNAHGHPEKFSRLWKREDVTDVLSDEFGTKKIAGVALHLDKKWHGHWHSFRDLTRFSAQAFANMKKLRLLHLSGVELTGEYKDFPKELIWLCWKYFPLESIPDDFPTQPKLVALDLQYSNLKIVWKDCKLHHNLKILNLSGSRQLTKSPDFSKFPNLEKLILKGCGNLFKVHSSIGDLGRLSLVNLEDCKMLRDLPLNFYKSKSIETLILNGCSRFHNLADGLGDMVSLTILKADNTRIRQIPSSIVKLKKLRILSLSGCSLTEQLLAIPDLPKNLCVLKANGCRELETIPDFSEMSNMRELYLCDSFKLTEVPGLDKSLNSMTRIHMEGCTNLTADFRNNILQGWTSSGFGGIYIYKAKGREW